MAVPRPLPRRRPGRHDRPLITTTSSAPSHADACGPQDRAPSPQRGGGPYRSPTSSAWPPPPSKPCSPTWPGSPAKRYAEHRAPGDMMLHVDVKKLGNVPDGGGWRYFGRSQGEKNRVATAGKPRNPMIGIAFVHTVTDDHSEWPTPRSTTTKALSLPPAYCAACRPVRPARGHHPPGCCPTTAWPTDRISGATPAPNSASRSRRPAPTGHRHGPLGRARWIGLCQAPTCTTS